MISLRKAEWREARRSDLGPTFVDYSDIGRALTKVACTYEL